MKLIDNIIAGAIDSKESVADVLRKCLVLAYKLKNDQLKAWVEKELNGYNNNAELPDYRKARGNAMGLFLGPYQSQINNQPLPALNLEEEHQHFATDINLSQPIASYEGLDGTGNVRVPWPADITAYYQSAFIQGYALNEAWMLIPASLIKGLLDTVRTRLLTFALEIQSEIPSGDEAAVAEIPPATVDRLVHVVINGGNNIIGNVGTHQSVTVIKGDLEALKLALQDLGVKNEDIEKIEATIVTEGAGEPKVISEKTLDWIKRAAKKLGDSGVKLGGKVAEECIKQVIKGYFGL